MPGSPAGGAAPLGIWFRGGGTRCRGGISCRGGMCCRGNGVITRCPRTTIAAHMPHGLQITNGFSDRALGKASPLSNGADRRPADTLVVRLISQRNEHRLLRRRHQKWPAFRHDPGAHRYSYAAPRRSLAMLRSAAASCLLLELSSSKAMAAASSCSAVMAACLPVARAKRR